MKTILQKSAMLLVLTLFAFTSCKKDDNSTPGTASASIAPLLTNGTWKVGYFHDNSSDHTIDFTGYTFTFNSNGTMSAVGNNTTETGTWREDDNSTKEFHMTIGSSAPLSQISKGWIITLSSSSEIKLKDDNQSSSEVLYFAKI